MGGVRPTAGEAVAARNPCVVEVAGVSVTAEARLRADANAAMERYCDGVPDAFRELYTLTADRLFHYLLRRTGDNARAEDLMQQTLLHMHQARGRFTRGAPVFPWMYSIAHRLVIDWARRRGRETPSEEAENLPEPVAADGGADEQLIARELHARIERVLSALPEAQRAAYELVHQEGLSYAEAAEALGKTVASITSLVHRAVTALQGARLED